MLTGTRPLIRPIQSLTQRAMGTYKTKELDTIKRVLHLHLKALQNDSSNFTAQDRKALVSTIQSNIQTHVILDAHEFKTGESILPPNYNRDVREPMLKTAKVCIEILQKLDTSLPKVKGRDFTDLEKCSLPQEHTIWSLAKVLEARDAVDAFYEGSGGTEVLYVAAIRYDEAKVGLEQAVDHPFEKGLPLKFSDSLKEIQRINALQDASDKKATIPVSKEDKTLVGSLLMQLQHASQSGTSDFVKQISEDFYKSDVDVAPSHDDVKALITASKYINTQLSTPQKG